tara:strand:- start:48689 stop:48907 length:219 start_codon:yes stop_codon:yes gene_type:complete
VISTGKQISTPSPNWTRINYHGVILMMVRPLTSTAGPTSTTRQKVITAHRKRWDRISNTLVISLILSGTFMN